VTRPYSAIDGGYVPAAVRTHPGGQSVLFLDGADLTANPAHGEAVGYVNVGVTLTAAEVRLVLRPGLQLPHPLVIGMPAREADALARALHHNALYLNPTLDQRGPL
jgi:hypothetical protein